MLAPAIEELPGEVTLNDGKAGFVEIVEYGVQDFERTSAATPPIDTLSFLLLGICANRFPTQSAKVHSQKVSWTYLAQYMAERLQQLWPYHLLWFHWRRIGRARRVCHEIRARAQKRGIVQINYARALAELGPSCLSIFR